MKTLVHACLSVDGWHRWPNAPERQRFLSVSHRHQFQIKAVAEAKHQDRQIECFDLQDAVRQCLAPWRQADGTYDFGTMSCEMIASRIASDLTLRSCEVSEDGLQGAAVVKD